MALSAGGHAWAVDEWGSGRAGPAVLALHGFTGAGSDWAPLGEAWSGRVVAPDLLGHGGSDAPADPEAYALEAQAAALLELSATVGLERPWLWGYSYGGRLALRLLTAHGDRFAGAALIGATPGIEDPAARAARVAEDDARAAAIERDGAAAFLEAWAQRPLIATQARIEAGRRRAMAAARAEHTAAGLANALRGGGTGRMEPLWDRLAAVSCPTLLVTGAEDPKFAALAARMAARLPRAEHVAIPGAGHCAHLERPAATLAHLRAWSAAS